MAAHQISLTLKPGESKEFVFILGYAENHKDDKWEADQVINKQVADGMIKRYSSLDAVDKAFDELAAYWNDLLGNYQITSSF